MKAKIFKMLKQLGSLRTTLLKDVKGVSEADPILSKTFGQRYIWTTMCKSQIMRSCRVNVYISAKNSIKLDNGK